jgi:hypothetical protein
VFGGGGGGLVSEGGGYQAPRPKAGRVTNSHGEGRVRVGG